MITALLALGLHLTVVPPPEGAWLQSAPTALGERPSWRIVRRVIRRDKKGTESRAPWIGFAATAVSQPTPPESPLYSTRLLAPPRNATTPSGERGPPARSALL